MSVLQAHPLQGWRCESRLSARTRLSAEHCRFLVPAVVDVYQGWCGPCKPVVSLFQKMRIEVGLDLLHFALVRFLLRKKSHNSVNKLNMDEARSKKHKLPFSKRKALAVTVSLWLSLCPVAVTVCCSLCRHKGTGLTTKLYTGKKHVSLRCTCVSILASEHWWTNCHFQSPVCQDFHPLCHKGALLVNVCLKHKNGNSTEV